MSSSASITQALQQGLRSLIKGCAPGDIRLI